VEGGRHYMTENFNICSRYFYHLMLDKLSYRNWKFQNIRRMEANYYCFVTFNSACRLHKSLLPTRSRSMLKQFKSRSARPSPPKSQIGNEFRKDRPGSNIISVPPMWPALWISGEVKNFTSNFCDWLIEHGVLRIKSQVSSFPCQQYCSL